MKRWLYSLTAVVLALILLPPPVALGAQKKETNRAIGIVFDNSGSMYINNNTSAWCRATYAMEVFASTMNRGDVLQVYPMHPIEVNGRTYDENDPLTINGPSEAPTLRQIFTPKAGGTPPSTITAAYEGLKQLRADERWLIVLTDGTSFDGYGDGNPTRKMLEGMLGDYNREMNVLYLGIGASVAMPQVSGNPYTYFAAKASDSSEVTAKLTQLCNMIFGRDELKTSGKKLDFDVSMSKLIVFVQGSDVSSVTLKNSAGQTVSATGSPATPHYSTLGSGDRKASQKVDTSLQGVIVTYADCPAGSYSLSYDGKADSIGVYYEPDVDAKVLLTDENGQLVDVNAELPPGRYRLTYGLIDKNGNATSSALLGKTKFAAHYTVNGEEKTVESDRSQSVDIELHAGDTLNASLDVNYLSGYSIHTDSSDWGWPFGGFTCGLQPAGDLRLELAGGRASYGLSEMEKDGLFFAVIYYEGNQLTGKALDNVELSVDLTGGNAAYTVEQIEDSFLIHLQHPGKPEDTDCKKYELSCRAVYTLEDVQPAASEVVTAKFELKDDSYGLKAKLTAPQRYFTFSELGSGKPLRLELSHDGVPLTDPELAALSVSVDTEGIAYELTPVPGGSCYELRLKGDGSPAEGFHTVTCRVNGLDNLGSPVSAEDSLRIELRGYPQWLRWLVIFLILALLFTLIWLYMNMKVLPKNIRVNDDASTFTVRGKNIPGSSETRLSGGKKKRGSLSIRTPAFPANPLVEHGVTLTVEAISPRRVKSSRRHACITRVSAPDTSVTSVSIDGVSLTRNEMGNFVDASDPDSPLAIHISSGSSVMSMGRSVDKTAFSHSCELEFV